MTRLCIILQDLTPEGSAALEGSTAQDEADDAMSKAEQPEAPDRAVSFSAEGDQDENGEAASFSTSPVRHRWAPSVVLKI